MDECAPAPFRVVTVAREFGSGGGAIAVRLAEQLGWKLLDKEIVQEVARQAHVNPALVRELDETVDSWMHRVSRSSMWYGGFEGVATMGEGDVFDCDTMATLAGRLIEEAHAQGNCVIVGRGAQCLLQKRKDAFHVFVYAPWKQRMKRLREREPQVTDPEGLARKMDHQRIEYVRHYFQCDWANPHLYHVMISSCVGEERAARAIAGAMGVAARA